MSILYPADYLKVRPLIKNSRALLLEQIKVRLDYLKTNRDKIQRATKDKGYYHYIEPNMDNKAGSALEDKGGNVFVEVFYKDNKKDGYEIMYSLDKNDEKNVGSFTYYTNGLKHGDERIYDFFVYAGNDVFDTEKSYFDIERYIPHKTRNKIVYLKKLTFYDKGKKEGQQIDFYDPLAPQNPHVIKTITNYSNDQKHGIQSEWDRNGALTNIKFFYNGIELMTSIEYNNYDNPIYTFYKNLNVISQGTVDIQATSDMENIMPIGDRDPNYMFDISNYLYPHDSDIIETFIKKDK